jgi:hypothetical protein
MKTRNNMKIHSIILVVMVILFVKPCIAAELGFRDIKLGMSKEKVVEKLANYSEVSADYKNNGEIEYFASDVKGVNVKIYPSFVDNKLVSLKVEFDTPESSRVYSALVTKYGKPTLQKTVKKQNHMGAKITCSIATWNLKEGVIDFSEVGSEVDHGYAIITSKTGLKILRNAEKEKQKLPGF